MRVLVVEDNVLLLHHLTVQMKEMGHQIDAAADAKEADYFLHEHAPTSLFWTWDCPLKTV